MRHGRHRVFASVHMENLLKILFLLAEVLPLFREESIATVRGEGVLNITELKE